MTTYLPTIEDKAPAQGCAAYRSDGDTIPYVAAGAEAVGNIVIRNVVDNRIGVVCSLANSEDATATANDIIHLRVHGMFWAALNPHHGGLTDGDRLRAVANEVGCEFEPLDLGIHECVGSYPATARWALVRINVLWNCDVCEGVPSATPTASPTASPSVTPTTSPSPT